MGIMPARIGTLASRYFATGYRGRSGWIKTRPVRPSLGRYRPCGTRCVMVPLPAVLHNDLVVVHEVDDSVHLAELLQQNEEHALLRHTISHHYDGSSYPGNHGTSAGALSQTWKGRVTMKCSQQKSLTKLLLAICLSVGIGAAPAVYAAPIDINTADVATLDKSLDGVGPKLAQAIVDHRTKNGPFKSVDDLAKVKGMHKATVEKNRANIAVSQKAAAPK
jgi:competence protein ComEA